MFVVLCGVVVLLVVLRIVLKKRNQTSKHKLPYVSPQRFDIISQSQNNWFTFKGFIKNKPVDIRLSSEYLCWSKSEGRWKVLHQQEIIGSFLEVEDNKKQVSVTVNAWHAPKKDQELVEQPSKSQQPWFLVGSVFLTQVVRFGAFILGYEDKMYPLQLRFRFNTDYIPCSVSSRLEASRFHRILLHTISKLLPGSEAALRKAAQSSTNIPELPIKRRVLCVVNPRAGNKAGASVLAQLKPMMKDASELLEFHILETTHQNHAREIAAQEPLEDYCVIMCIGGDGTPHEVLNGIMDRPNGADILRRIHLCLVPAGTGNGLTTSIGISSPQDSFMRLVHGNSRQADAMVIEQETNPQFQRVYSLLQVSFGMMSDVDFESEKIRWMGDLRFTLWAFFRLIFLREYPVTMTYTPVMTKVVTESNQVDWVPGDEEVRFSGNVVWCGGLSTAWMSSDFKCAPIAQMDDGLIHMVTIGRLRTKLSMFKLFFEMSSGQHLKCPYFNMATTKKFILESPSIPGVPSRLDVDGECIFTQANEPISVSIIPSMCTISV